MKEIEDMVRVDLEGRSDVITITSDENFKHRTAVTKRVLLALTPDDRASINKIIEDGEDIVPTAIKQQ